MLKEICLRCLWYHYSHPLEGRSLLPAFPRYIFTFSPRAVPESSLRECKWGLEVGETEDSQGQPLTDCEQEPMNKCPYLLLLKQIILGNMCTFLKRPKQKQAPIAHNGDLNTKSLFFPRFLLHFPGIPLWLLRPS